MLSRKCIKTGTDRKKTLKDQYIVYSKVSKANLKDNQFSAYIKTFGET